MIDINGIKWSVLLVDPYDSSLLRSDNSYAIGVCDNTLKNIYLSNDLNKQYAKKVLSHELTHAAMFSYGIDLSLEKEELVADLIATYG